MSTNPLRFNGQKTINNPVKSTAFAAVILDKSRKWSLICVLLRGGAPLMGNSADSVNPDSTGFPDKKPNAMDRRPRPCRQARLKSLPSKTERPARLSELPSLNRKRGLLRGRPITVHHPIYSTPNCGQIRYRNKSVHLFI